MHWELSMRIKNNKSGYLANTTIAIYCHLKGKTMVGVSQVLPHVLSFSPMGTVKSFAWGPLIMCESFSRLPQPADWPVPLNPGTTCRDAMRGWYDPEEQSFSRSFQRRQATTEHIYQQNRKNRQRNKNATNIWTPGNPELAWICAVQNRRDMQLLELLDGRFWWNGHQEVRSRLVHRQGDVTSRMFYSSCSIITRWYLRGSWSRRRTARCLYSDSISNQIAWNGLLKPSRIMVHKAQAVQSEKIGMTSVFLTMLRW